MHVFYAHGGGLGHLTRISKLIKILEIPVNDVLIITPSTFTKYFKSYTFVKILWNETVAEWSNTIKNTIESYTITTFYVDTFPFGIKGELSSVYTAFPKLEYVYVSRVLKWQNYLDAIPVKTAIKFSKTIILEIMYDEHMIWIKNNSKKIKQIMLQNKQVSSISFHDKPYILIVHSGGKEDVLKICNRASKDYHNKPEIVMVVFTQVDINIKDSRILLHKDIYPVSQYFEHAKKIYTAAGFNSIQELQSYNDKHVVIPLNKLYDDQFFRYEKRLKNDRLQ
ncbi:hypothetical protein D1816_04020 [Aquimarina sp. AD10]|uniref:hypothetical protein n=1 Tax=Aquimarina sp. AD10 TaxID=1714849 RepID=UPI000E4ED731|nr:hypothetical protein [Aquimarina sp. AD10]AXT59555.1 hypothetical protein D1816_04020 [Aquimarina sp. AD10]RKM93454.1 hypothetical protein D7033_19705 [Aquimarina sp. AD10]